MLLLLIRHLVLYSGNGVKVKFALGGDNPHSLQAYNKCYDVSTHIKLVLQCLWHKTLELFKAYPALCDPQHVPPSFLNGIAEPLQRELAAIESLTKNMTNI